MSRPRSSFDCTESRTTMVAFFWTKTSRRTSEGSTLLLVLCLSGGMLFLLIPLLPTRPIQLRMLRARSRIWGNLLGSKALDLGRKFLLILRPPNRTENVKAKIQDKDGCPSNQRRLIWAGKELLELVTLFWFPLSRRRPDMFSSTLHLLVHHLRKTMTAWRHRFNWDCQGIDPVQARNSFGSAVFDLR